MNSCEGKTKIIQVGSVGTNLTYTADPIQGVVNSNNGTDAVIPLADLINAGLMSPAQVAALSATTLTNAQIGVGNTYIQVVDPITGAINFVVDGVVEMSITPGKITIPNLLDPKAYIGTPQTIAQRDVLPVIAGMLVWVVDGLIKEWQYYDGTTWKSINNSVYANQTEVTLGVVTDKIVAPNTLKVELDKKLDDTQLIDDDTFATATSTNIASAESVKAYVDGKTVIVDNLTSTITTSSLSANQGRLLNGFDIASGLITGTDLIFTLKGGTTITVDVTNLLTDIKLTSGVYNSTTKNLDLTLSNATVVSIPVSALLPIIHDDTLSGDGAVTNLSVPLSTDVNNILSLGTDGRLKVNTQSTNTILGLNTVATQIEVTTGTDSIKTIASDTLKVELDKKVDENIAIVSATKTKITYDSKGLVTAGVDATTTDIAEGINLYFTDERSQDSVGSILVDSTTIDFTYDDTTPSITAIVIDNSITNVKLAQVPTLTLKGNNTGATANVKDLTADEVNLMLIKYQSVTASTVVTLNDEIIEVDSTLNSIVITLPNTAVNGKRYYISWIAGTNPVTIIDSTGSTLINESGNAVTTITIPVLNSVFNYYKSGSSTAWRLF